MSTSSLEKLDALPRTVAFVHLSIAEADIETPEYCLAPRRDGRREHFVSSTLDGLMSAINRRRNRWLPWRAPLPFPHQVHDNRRVIGEDGLLANELVHVLRPKRPRSRHDLPVSRFAGKQKMIDASRQDVYETGLPELRPGRRVRTGIDTLETPPKTLYVRDITTEKLASILQENPRGVAVIHDELTGWVKSMDQYRSGKGADRQFWLSAWSGAPISVHRKNQEAGPVRVAHSFVGVVGGLPPALLETMRGEKDIVDGFLERIVSYFCGHLRRVYSARDADERVTSARKLLRWIGGQASRRFTRRDAYRLSSITRPNSAIAALKVGPSGRSSGPLASGY